MLILDEFGEQERPERRDGVHDQREFSEEAD